MNALVVLYGGSLNKLALEPVCAGRNALSLALSRVAAFPGAEKTILLLPEAFDESVLPAAGDLPPGFETLRAPVWTKKSLLETIAAASEGFSLSYFVWADCPFLDAGLAGAVAARHTRYAAEYSYADGWPYGLAPELLSPGTAGILSKIIAEDDGPVGRDTLFSVLRKDINAFDIETEISPVDLRSHRLSFSADSKRNLLLLRRFAEASGGTVPDASVISDLIGKKPELLRTLPKYFPIQVSGPCPQACPICPYPHFGRGPGGEAVTERRDFMETGAFGELLDKIIAFCGDAVIDLSLWGEIALHPRRLELIDMVLARPALSLIIETSGIGWLSSDPGSICAAVSSAAKRENDCGPEGDMPPLSWIVSLDAFSQERYLQARGTGFPEALAFARRLRSLFPEDTWVQAVRVQGTEDDIEQFYRSWKEGAPKNGGVIIQKYDDFCGALPKRQASDLSPVERQSCWHIMRDFPVLIDGSVPACREDLPVLKLPVLKEGRAGILGNALSGSLETIWTRGEDLYLKHTQKNYPGICAECDEYYTYNF
ncbi:MAG: spiro-SPASM protein [Treponema sp.]|jgi:spiro-SPASM protein|nr:spiro-SPASM protein [Treponema sp.]